MKTQTNHLENKKNVSAYDYGILETKLLAQTHKKFCQELMVATSC
jgi:hypothetical protein